MLSNLLGYYGSRLDSSQRLQEQCRFTGLCILAHEYIVRACRSTGIAALNYLLQCLIVSYLLQADWAEFWLQHLMRN
jgi:hypothetical protein